VLAVVVVDDELPVTCGTEEAGKFFPAA